MSRIRFVVEGKHDEYAIPPIVRTILGADFESTFDFWREIRLTAAIKLGQGSLFTKKLKFAMRTAQDAQDHAVVAVLDTDNTNRGERLAELKSARDNSALPPTAIGEATPHLEAWLLDDQRAVRTALGLPTSARIEAPTNCDPKPTLTKLCDNCPARTPGQPIAELYAMIATAIREDRCAHDRETGFQDFAREIRAIVALVIVSG